MRAAQEAAAQKLGAQQAQLPSTPEEPAVAAAAPAAAAGDAAAAAGAGAGAAAAGVAAGAAAGGMLGGMLRALTGSRSGKDLERDAEKKAAKEAAAAKKAEEKAVREAEKAAREAEKKAAKEAEAAAKEAAAREAAEAAAREAEAAAARDAELAAAAAAAATAIAGSQGAPSPVHSFTAGDMPAPVLVTPPGGGAPIPMLPLAVPPSDVQASVVGRWRAWLGNVAQAAWPRLCLPAWCGGMLWVQPTHIPYSPASHLNHLPSLPEPPFQCAAGPQPGLPAGHAGGRGSRAQGSQPQPRAAVILAPARQREWPDAGPATPAFPQVGMGWHNAVACSSFNLCCHQPVCRTRPAAPAA